MSAAPTEGIHLNVPEVEYRQMEGVNQSSLKKILPPWTPAHYKAALDAGPKEPTSAQMIGTFVHRGFFDSDFSGWALRPEGLDMRKKEGKDWLAQQPPGTEPVTVDIRAIVDSLWADPLISQIMRSRGGNGVAGWKVHEPTGLLLKGLADSLRTDANNYTVGVDLKTVGENESCAAWFANEAKTWRYDIQDCHYRYIFGCTYFIFIVVEKVPPYVCACHTIDAESQEKATADWMLALNTVAECRERGQWPKRQPAINRISLRWPREALA